MNLKKQILVVDDSPFIVEMVGRIVEGLGHNAIKVRDGEMALTRAAQMEPDMIILDVQMPKIDGLTVLAALRKDARFTNTPILMLSSVRDGEVVRRSILSKATAYVLKDDPDEIKKRIEDNLG